MGGLETQKPAPKQAGKSEALTSENAIASIDEKAESVEKIGRRAATEASLDEMETREIDQPIKNLPVLTKGYPEVNSAKYKDIVAQALENVKKEAGKAGNIHGSKFEVTWKDGYEYIYIRDNTHKPSDRLFRSENAVTSVENEYADANLKEGYSEATEKIAQKILKVAQGRFKGNPPVANLYIEDLVNNRIISHEAGKDIDGDLAFIIKIGGKTRVFLGWEKK
jgi:hypothetical protein